MSANREVNSKKSDRLGPTETLKSALERILNRCAGYNSNMRPATGDRFFSAVKSAVALVYSIDGQSFDDIFVRFEFQRLQSKHGQQIPG